MISTVAADLGDQYRRYRSACDDPDLRHRVQALLARMVANGLTHCVLEMTSHGLGARDGSTALTLMSQ